VNQADCSTILCTGAVCCEAGGQEWPFACELTAPQSYVLVQFVVKLADKNDYLLASKVLASGVEFGVLKQVWPHKIALRDFAGLFQHLLRSHVVCCSCS
jgi:hypothetical protein